MKQEIKAKRLKRRNIFVCILCPGLVPTNLIENSQKLAMLKVNKDNTYTGDTVNQDGKFKSVDHLKTIEGLPHVTPQECAGILFDGLRKKQFIVYTNGHPQLTKAIIDDRCEELLTQTVNNRKRHAKVSRRRKIEMTRSKL